MLSIDVLKWIPLISLLLCIPSVCYKDITTRRVEHNFWIPLVAVNIPVALALLVAGYYEPWMYLFTIAPICLYFILQKKHYIEGADFMFMMFITLFFMINPYSGRYLMSIPFAIFLVSSFIITGAAVILYNFTHGNGLSVKIKHGVPMMFPISAALILTAVLA